MFEIQDIDPEPTTMERRDYCDDRNFCAGASSPHQICNGHTSHSSLYE